MLKPPVPLKDFPAVRGHLHRVCVGQVQECPHCSAIAAPAEGLCIQVHTAMECPGCEDVEDRTLQPGTYTVGAMRCPRDLGTKHALRLTDGDGRRIVVTIGYTDEPHANMVDWRAVNLCESVRA